MSGVEDTKVGDSGVEDTGVGINGVEDGRVGDCGAGMRGLGDTWVGDSGVEDTWVVDNGAGISGVEDTGSGITSGGDAGVGDIAVGIKGVEDTWTGINGVVDTGVTGSGINGVVDVATGGSAVLISRAGDSGNSVSSGGGHVLICDGRMLISAKGSSSASPETCGLADAAWIHSAISSGRGVATLVEAGVMSSNGSVLVTGRASSTTGAFGASMTVVLTVVSTLGVG